MYLLILDYLNVLLLYYGSGDSARRNVLLIQLHGFILSFLTFIVDLTFRKILNIWDGKIRSKIGEFRYPYSYSSRAKGFISANVQGSKRCRAKP